MNAGSYVIKPKSSSLTLIWRRSIALIVPSLTGTSYVLPVRLSVMVRVSAIAAVNLLQIAEAGSDDHERGDRRGFGAQAARSEALEMGVVIARQRELALAPSPLGADEDGCSVARLRGRRRDVGVAQDLESGARDRVIKRCWRFDRRDDAAPRLLHRLEHDPFPALVLARVALRAQLDAIGDERDDCADAELRRLLQHELELLELNDRHRQRDVERRLARRDLVADVQHRVIFCDRLHDRMRHLPAAVEHLDGFAFPQTHDADRVVELVTADGDGRLNRVDENPVVHVKPGSWAHGLLGS